MVADAESNSLSLAVTEVSAPALLSTHLFLTEFLLLCKSGLTDSYFTDIDEDSII